MQVPGAVIVPAAGGQAHRSEVGFAGLVDGVTAGMAGLRAEHPDALLAAEDRYRLLGSGAGNLSARFGPDLSRGCYRAVKTGTESLTASLLDEVRIDQAAEDVCGQLQAARPAKRARAPAAGETIAV